AAIADVRQQVNSLQDRPARLRAEIAALDERIASLTNELNDLQKQIRQLTRPQGDYEAVLWHKALKEREENLLADIKRSNESLKGKRVELERFGERRQEL